MKVPAGHHQQVAELGLIQAWSPRNVFRKGALSLKRREQGIVKIRSIGFAWVDLRQQALGAGLTS